MRRHLAELPQGRKAARAGVLCRVRGGPLHALAMLATGQLGVPVAATTIGTQLGLLRLGESAALILGFLVAQAVTVVGGSLAARVSRAKA